MKDPIPNSIVVGCECDSIVQCWELPDGKYAGTCSICKREIIVDSEETTYDCNGAE